MAISLPHGFKRWSSLEDVRANADLLANSWRGQLAFQRDLAQRMHGEFEGFCAVCEVETQFCFAAPENEADWRESLACGRCGLINRWRSSAHMARLYAAGRPPGPIYLTEQTTELYRVLTTMLGPLTGSEYLGSQYAGGATVDWHGRSLRHEDITALSFADASLSMVMSFDVLEHVPEYSRAISEFARVLQPGGVLLLTAPFGFNVAETVIRARRHPDGTIEHLLPAIHHGDPLNDEGVLCFQEFGWDLLEALRARGFTEVSLITAWAPEYGYLGTFQTFIVGRR